MNELADSLPLWQRRATIAYVVFAFVSAGALGYSYFTDPYGVVLHRHARASGIGPDPVLLLLSTLIPLVEAGVVFVLLRPRQRLTAQSVRRAFMIGLAWFAVVVVATPTDLPLVVYFHRVWLGCVVAALGAALIVAGLTGRAAGDGQPVVQGESK